jgi:hypothetical protein
MKELQPPSVSGLAEALEIQKIIDEQESTDSIKFDEVLKRLPTIEGGAVTTIRYVFCKRYLPFDLACLIALIADMIAMCVRAQPMIPQDTVRTLYEFTEEHLTEAERQIGQSAQSTALLWFIVQLRRFLREQVEEHKPW